MPRWRVEVGWTAVPADGAEDRAAAILGTLGPWHPEAVTCPTVDEPLWLTTIVLDEDKSHRAAATAAVVVRCAAAQHGMDDFQIHLMVISRQDGPPDIPVRAR